MVATGIAIVEVSIRPCVSDKKRESEEEQEGFSAIAGGLHCVMANLVPGIVPRSV